MFAISIACLFSITTSSKMSRSSSSIFMQPEVLSFSSIRAFDRRGGDEEHQALFHVEQPDQLFISEGFVKVVLNRCGGHGPVDILKVMRRNIKEVRRKSRITNRVRFMVEKLPGPSAFQELLDHVNLGQGDRDNKPLREDDTDRKRGEGDIGLCSLTSGCPEHDQGISFLRSIRALSPTSERIGKKIGGMLKRKTRSSISAWLGLTTCT